MQKRLEYGRKRTRLIAVRFSEDEYQALEQLAGIKRQTVSDTVRASVKEAIGDAPPLPRPFEDGVVANLDY